MISHVTSAWSATWVVHDSHVIIAWSATWVVHDSHVVTLSHPHMTTRKAIALTRWTFVNKVMSLLFNMLSKLVMAFLPRSKRLLISWLQSPSAVILEPKKIKSVTVSMFFPIYLPRSVGTGCHNLCFLNVEFKPTFSLSSFTFIKSSLVLLHFLP